IFVVDGVTQLPERGAVRVLFSVSVFVRHARVDAAGESFETRRALAVVREFVTIMRRATARIGLVTKLAHHFAFCSARGRVGFARRAGDYRVVVVAAAAKQEKSRA